MGILDTIIDSNRGSLTQNFEPLLIVGSILDSLKDRDKHILAKRYGLRGNDEQTLEKIGKELQLTRERVRQIEKSLLKQLKEEHGSSASIVQAKELIHALLSDHGGLMAEADLLEKLGIDAVEEANAIRFLLLLISDIESVRNHVSIKEAWKALHFDVALFNDFITTTREVLDGVKKPHSAADFLASFKNTQFYKDNSTKLTDKVILNFLNAAKNVSKNTYGEYGLAHWRDINPRDVGDKAYLVLKHHGKPEHYTKITELINKNYPDGREAHKETVHNELIKDRRFVLVGRGIYGLAEWGYKPGVVSDVIIEILKKVNGPLPRKEIIEQVLAQRMVQRNTILVALSDKKKFRKVGREGYELAV